MMSKYFEAVETIFNPDETRLNFNRDFHGKRYGASPVMVYGGDEQIALAAKISYGKTIIENFEEVERIIRRLIVGNEQTPFEYASIWFYVWCSRSCHSQFLQYRMASRLTRSTRRVAPMDVEFPELQEMMPEGYAKTYLKQAVSEYEFQVECNREKREDARDLFPFCSVTEFYWLVNIRELQHFLSQRLHPKAEDEIKGIAKEMEGIFKKHFPITHKMWRAHNDKV